jgi:hypothetical protein
MYQIKQDLANKAYQGNYSDSQGKQTWVDFDRIDPT